MNRPTEPCPTCSEGWRIVGMSCCEACARGWHTIDTAPKNGEPVNIYVPIHQPDRRVLTAYWTDAGWWICSGSIVCGKPTHWMPLPPAPLA